MEPYPNKFGARLRRLVEEKGLTLADFAERYGLAESQIHNWLKRDEPPLAKHWDKLASFFGVDRSVIIGAPFSDTAISESSQAAYGTPEMLKSEVQRIVGRALKLAGEDVGRLGWLREQVAIHLAPPAHWEADVVAQVIADHKAEEDRKDFEAVEAVRHHQSAARAHGKAS